MSSTILVVDDDASARRALGELLTDEGFRVELARDGQEALEMLASCEPDVVLSDLDMPRIGGEALIVQLSSLRPELPVIVITAHAAVDAEREAKRLGVAGFVNKPLNIIEVIERIQSVLKQTMSNHEQS